MDPIQAVHVKLQASDLSSLAVRPSRSPSFSRKGRPVSRAETLGVVVSRERRDKFLKFHVDDGSGCVPYVLWLNQRSLTPRGGSDPLDLEAEMALEHAEAVRLGPVVRVRGRITSYRSAVQITVGDVVAERDPNAEVLHRLDCIRLALRCYDAPPPASPGSHKQRMAPGISSVSNSKPN